MSGDRAADLLNMLRPHSIAVIGASDAPRNLGGVAVEYLQRFRFTGETFPVNPRQESVRGLPCFRSIRQVPAVVDLAILAVPGQVSPQLVRECGEAGVRRAVLWAGGFAEVGQSGAELQEQLAAACRGSRLDLLGPNSIGFINSADKVTATFASFLSEEAELVPGAISMVSQSGGLGTMFHALAQRGRVGLRYMISTGNEVTLGVADFIEALCEDEGTSVISCYVEGVDDGRKLERALAKAQRIRKPIVMLKGGMGPGGARAAAAHTGALAGAGRVWRAVLEEYGVLLVESLDELFDVSVFVSTEAGRRTPVGRRLAIVTFGGGGGVLATDQALSRGLEVVPLTAATREELRPLVPSIASTENPVDLTPQGFNDPRYLGALPEALSAIAGDEGVDMVLALFGPMATGLPGVIDAVATLDTATAKPVCVAWPLGPEGSYERMRQRGHHVFRDSAPAIAALWRIAKAGSAKVREDAPRAPVPGRWDDLDRPVTAPAILPEHVTERILRSSGLPTAVGEVVKDEAELCGVIGRLGFPVAMKVVSTEVTHREAAGLVSLGIGSKKRAEEAFQDLIDKASELGVSLEGVYVQQMVGSGEEILVSAFRDPVFGDMVSCGAGGTRAELLDDIELMRGPITPSLAIEFVSRLRVVRFAHERGWAIEPLGAFVAQLSEVAASAPWTEFVLEVNPVRWLPDRVVAVDGLAVVEVV